MRIALFTALIGLAVAVQPADARPSRDQNAAYRGVQEGNILPLSAIRSRVRVPNADFIGAELDRGGSVYRLKYMRGTEVIWIDVDARTGRPLGRSGN